MKFSYEIIGLIIPTKKHHTYCMISYENCVGMKERCISYRMIIGYYTMIHTMNIPTYFYTGSHNFNREFVGINCPGND